MTVSYWKDRSWSSEHHADVVVVGAGLCGASCAWWLAQEGLGVALVDASEPGGGASCQGLGLVAGPAEPYGRMVERLGRERAQAVMALSHSGRAHLLEHIIADQGQQVSLVTGGLLHAASSARTAEELERAEWLMSEDGFGLEWLDRETVTDGVGTAGLLGGLLDPAGLSVHPLQLLELLLARGSESGVGVQGRQRVFAVEAGPSEVVLKCEGATFHAEQVVLCQGGASALMESVLVDCMRPRLGRLLATAPLDGRMAPWSLVVEEGAVQAQQQPGGEVVAACWRDATGRGPWEAIRSHLGRLEDARVSHQWRWRALEPADGLPLVGALPGSGRVKYVVGCLDGGIALGFGAAQALARWLVDDEDPGWLGVGRLSSSAE